MREWDPEETEDPCSPRESGAAPNALPIDAVRAESDLPGHATKPERTPRLDGRQRIAVRDR